MIEDDREYIFFSLISLRLEKTAAASRAFVLQNATRCAWFMRRLLEALGSVWAAAGGLILQQMRRRSEGRENGREALGVILGSVAAAEALGCC